MSSYETTVTLGQFIANLLKGDGWHRAGIPVMIGRALESMNLDLTLPVTVKYRSGHYGSGPRSWSEYDWEVTGLTIPSGTIPGTAPIFGGIADVQIQAIPGGVRFSHASGAVRNRW